MKRTKYHQPQHTTVEVCCWMLTAVLGAALLASAMIGYVSILAA